MHAYCKFNGIGIIPYSPLCRGHLARPVSSPLTDRSKVFVGTRFEQSHSAQDRIIIGRVEELALKKNLSDSGLSTSEHGHGQKWTMARIALAWICAKVTSPIVGINSLERLEESIVGKDMVLTEDEVRYLEEP